MYGCVKRNECNNVTQIQKLRKKNPRVRIYKSHPHFRRRGEIYDTTASPGMADQRLNTAAWRRRDGMGCTSTSATPRPTVSPIATEMSCSAVWKPERYELDCPAVVCDANVSSPPFPSPDGTWNSIPVICAGVRCSACDEDTQEEKTHHDHKGVASE